MDRFDGPQLAIGSFKSLRFFDLGFVATDGVGRVVMTPTFMAHCVYDSGDWNEAICGRPRIDKRRISAILGTERFSIGDVLYSATSGELVVEVMYYDLRNDLLNHSLARLYRDDTRIVEVIPLKHVQIPQLCTTPDRSCDCGFYSFYSIAHVLSSQESTTGGIIPPGPVMAVVENSGRVLHGTMGIRSQRMRILGWTWATTFSDFNAPSRDYPTPKDLMNTWVMHRFELPIWTGYHRGLGVTSFSRAECQVHLSLVAPFFKTWRELLAALPLDGPPDFNWLRRM